MTCGLLLFPFFPLLLLGCFRRNINVHIVFWIRHSEDLSNIMGRATLLSFIVIKNASHPAPSYSPRRNSPRLEYFNILS